MADTVYYEPVYALVRGEAEVVRVCWMPPNVSSDLLLWVKPIGGTNPAAEYVARLTRNQVAELREALKEP